MEYVKFRSPRKNAETRRALHGALRPCCAKLREADAKDLEHYPAAVTICCVGSFAAGHAQSKDLLAIVCQTKLSSLRPLPVLGEDPRLFEPCPPDLSCATVYHDSPPVHATAVMSLASSALQNVCVGVFVPHSTPAALSTVVSP